jgi:hypothetical protein
MNPLHAGEHGLQGFPREGDSFVARGLGASGLRPPHALDHGFGDLEPGHLIRKELGVAQ